MLTTVSGEGAYIDKEEAITTAGIYGNVVLTAYEDYRLATVTPPTGQDGTYNREVQTGYTGEPSATYEGASIAVSFDITYYIKNGDSWVKTTSANSGAASTGGKPKFAGEYKVKFEIPTSEGYKGEAETTFKISTVELKISGLSAENKEYDGNTTATISGTPVLEGILTDDTGDVTLLGTASGKFADKNIGTGKEVKVTGLTLSGDAAKGYALSDTVTALNADITPKTLTATAKATDRVYNGLKTVDVNGTLNGVVTGDSVTIAATTGTMADASAGTDKTVSGINFVLSGDDAGNYTLTQPTATVTIQRNRLP